MRSGSLLLVATLAACFSPDTSRIVLLCDPQNACPEGQACVNGRCQAPLSGDLGAGDADSDMSVEPGCARGIAGTQVGGAWACPGGFAIGGARSRCRAGWIVCRDATRVDQSVCNKLGGFFVGDVPSWSPGVPADMCGEDTGTSNRGWHGCGQRATWVSNSSAKCGGFLKLLDCQPSAGWDCFSGTTLDKTGNSNSSDGLLCCPGT